MPEAWFLGVGSFAIPVMDLASPSAGLLREAITGVGVYERPARGGTPHGPAHATMA